MSKKIKEQLENYLKEKYLTGEELLRFGRLPVHEYLKVECAIFGEHCGFSSATEFKIGSKRIDVVWMINRKVEVAIEIDEGINLRALQKMNDSGAKTKICVFFDVRKMAQRYIDHFDFTNFQVIQLQRQGFKPSSVASQRSTRAEKIDEPDSTPGQRNLSV